MSKVKYSMAKKLEKLDIFNVAAAFLIAEGCLSLFGSTDQRPICTIGRLVRIGIGISMVAYKW